jgi:hypothetical protein
MWPYQPAEQGTRPGDLAAGICDQGRWVQPKHTVSRLRLCARDWANARYAVGHALTIKDRETLLEKGPAMRQKRQQSCRGS